MGNIPLPSITCVRKKSADNNNDVEATSTHGEPKREIWANKTEYMLVMVGYAVGLGNVWRFPYLTYKHGGGAFLIPYVIMLALAGLPMCILECAVGQFASAGPIKAWRISPFFQGLGVTMVLISAMVSIYYNVIVAYGLYYLFASFRSYLPWSECFEWADSKCRGTLSGSCNVTLENMTVIMNVSWAHMQNLTCDADNTTELPSKQYWEKVALRQSSGLDETGVVVWHMALCLLLAWVLTVASLFKGIQSSGKVVYFTALFPYVVLIILLVRGVTLEGSIDGIEYYIGRQSDITKLKDGEVWRDAATQIFYSLSVAWGGLQALSSYNKFHNNTYWDCIIVCSINCLTCVLAGFAIFSILGHMALVSGKHVSQVVDEGFGLAFIAYPDALTKLPISPLWSILFFFMLLTLGLDTQLATVETITTAIQDTYPRAMKKMRFPITIALCVLLFLLGLPCVTQSGIYWVNLIDAFCGGWALLFVAVLELIAVVWIYGKSGIYWVNLIDAFCGGWALLFVAVLELIAVVWIYGGNRLILDIEMMIGKKNWIFWLWWRACWYVVSPALLTVILVWSLVTFTPPVYGGTEYPTWGINLGFLMVAFCLIWIPITAIMKVCQASGNIFQRIATTCRPAENWGPALPENRGERYRHMKDDTNEEVEIPDIPSCDDKGCDNTSFQKD